jgi:hypothetical protein
MEGDVTGLIAGFQQLFKDFHAAWFIGLSTFLYIVIQILRGKFGFSVPFITAAFEKLPALAKTYILLGLFGVAGGLMTLGMDKFSIWLFLDGMLSGVTTGLTAMGIHEAGKKHIETITELRAGGESQPK